MPSEASAQDSQKLSLDGDQDYATAPDSPEISFEGSSNVNMTIEAWIKHDGQSDVDARIFDKLDGSGYGYDLHLVGSGEEVPVQLTIGDNRSTTITSDTGVPAGRWTHVAVTYDGTTLSLYLNGQLEKSFEDSHEIWDGDASPHIGTNETAGGNFFSGEIDELRIWTTTRTATEIREDRFTSLSGSESGLIAYYPLDSGAPTADQSGNGHALTLQGNATTEARDALPVPPDLYVENEGNEQVRLRWEERTGPSGANEANSFNVYQSPPTGLNGRSQIAQPSASGSPAYTATSLSNGKTYFWEVTAEDGSGRESDFSPVMTGTPRNGSEPTPLKGGSALALDGSGDYGTVGDRPSLSITGDSITVEAWIKHDGENNEDAFILHKRGSNGYGYGLRLVGSGEEVPIRFIHEGNRAQSITSKAGVPADRWTHVAVVSEVGEMRLYLNGELDNTVGDDKGIWDNDEPLRIGTNRTEDGRFFSGRIDEVRLWDDARTQAEIQQHNRLELLGSEENLRAYFRLNETPGTSVSRAAAKRPKTVALNGDADFASSLSLYPSTLSATISRSFGGAASSSDYRLVALPGDISRPLADVVSGEAGLEWQAYHDDGTDSDFLKKYDGSDTFTLEPGAGFWLTATSDWTHDVNASTVSLQGDSAAVIGLQDGWNVVSNPTDRAVSYDRLVTANQAAANGPLQPLWAFDGTFNQTDSMDSAAEGVAYYFLNDQGLDSLRIPYPGLSTKKKSTDRDAPDLFRLAATPADVEGASASTVQLGFTKDAPASSSVVAPPGRFESVSLRIAPEAAAQRPARQRFLMRTLQSIDSEGSTFDLQLTSRTNGPIHLSVENTEALGGQSARLLVPSKGTSHDLTAKGTVTITPSGEDMNLRLAVGTQHYVETQAAQITPDEVALTTYPNPVHQQGTLEYTLPEAGKVTLRVYDVLGREVATLVDGRKEAGRHTVRLATDQLSSGVYFGRLTAGEQHLTQKMTVVR